MVDQEPLRLGQNTRIDEILDQSVIFQVCKIFIYIIAFLFNGIMIIFIHIDITGINMNISFFYGNFPLARESHTFSEKIAIDLLNGKTIAL
jgi:hypothetical protein